MLPGIIHLHLLSQSTVPLIQGCHAQGRRRDFSAAWRRGRHGGRHQCLPHLTEKHKLTSSACCKDSCRKTPTHRFSCTCIHCLINQQRMPIQKPDTSQHGSVPSGEEDLDWAVALQERLAGHLPAKHKTSRKCPLTSENCL